ncbi:MAG: hypothetical protein WCS77_08165 [Elusimicrobiaceae bacterium]|jgi:hypothetical protein
MKKIALLVAAVIISAPVFAAEKKAQLPKKFMQTVAVDFLKAKNTRQDLANMSQHAAAAFAYEHGTPIAKTDTIGEASGTAIMLYNNNNQSFAEWRISLREGSNPIMGNHYTFYMETSSTLYFRCEMFVEGGQLQVQNERDIMKFTSYKGYMLGKRNNLTDGSVVYVLFEKATVN